MGCGISQHGEGAFEDGRYNMVGRQVPYGSSGASRYDGHYVRTRNASNARSSSGKEKEENPEATAEQTATRLLLYGNALMEKTNFTEAVEAYSKALLYKEDLERVYLERGLAYFKLKEVSPKDQSPGKRCIVPTKILTLPHPPPPKNSIADVQGRRRLVRSDQDGNVRADGLLCEGDDLQGARGAQQRSGRHDLADREVP